jgi:lipoyl(octanoyl) transferase
MDMRPFANINPCGYQGMAVTQLRDLSANIDLNLLNAQLRELLIHHISK